MRIDLLYKLILPFIEAFFFCFFNLLFFYCSCLKKTIPLFMVQLNKLLVFLENFALISIFEN